jgi:hypothetical protein
MCALGGYSPRDNCILRGASLLGFLGCSRNAIIRSIANSCFVLNAHSWLSHTKFTIGYNIHNCIVEWKSTWSHLFMLCFECNSGYLCSMCCSSLKIVSYAFIEHVYTKVERPSCL